MVCSTNTVIIGAGISGMTAAIYLKRANIPFIILEKGVLGGQINRASSIENYPGITKIDGPTLVNNLYEQMKNLDIEIKFKEVKRIEVNDKKHVILNDEIIECENIIVATGKKIRTLDLENEKELTGKGISYCALCDGMFFKNKDVAVVGGGNSAVQEALYLSNICHKVYLIHHNNHFRADNEELEKIKKKENVVFKENQEIIKINGTNCLESIEISDEILEVQGLFIYIGSLPDISFLNGLNIDNNNGYLIVNSEMETNIKGIYAVGDAILKDVYQLTTSIGEATIAANQIIKDR